jgi:hypothetical protein
MFIPLLFLFVLTVLTTYRYINDLNGEIRMEEVISIQCEPEIILQLVSCVLLSTLTRQNCTVVIRIYFIELILSSQHINEST